MNVGEASYSMQWRCPNMARHYGLNPLPKPCEECYSLACFTVVVPYVPFVPYTTLGAFVFDPKSTKGD